MAFLRDVTESQTEHEQRAESADADRCVDRRTADLARELLLELLSEAVVRLRSRTT